jgi:hypothetical protein
MDDFRIDSLGFRDSPFGQTQDGSKRRPKQGQGEPEEEATDQVTLSSADDSEEQASGYFPASSDEESS